jgi:N-acetylneuraminate synthase
LEFEQAEYEEIDHFCKSVKIQWFASPWDEESTDFLEQFNPPVHKIASASLTVVGR